MHHASTVVSKILQKSPSKFTSKSTFYIKEKQSTESVQGAYLKVKYYRYKQSLNSKTSNSDIKEWKANKISVKLNTETKL